MRSRLEGKPDQGMDIYRVKGVVTIVSRKVIGREKVSTPAGRAI